MEILELSRDVKTASNSDVHIELSLSEVSILNNALYQYKLNHNQNDIAVLYEQMKIIRELLNYGRTSIDLSDNSKQSSIYQSLKRWADDNNDSEINWDNHNQPKWYIWYDNKGNRIKTNYTPVIQHLGQIYFTSEDLVMKAVEVFGEDNLKKYLFGIERKD